MFRGVGVALDDSDGAHEAPRDAHGSGAQDLMAAPPDGTANGQRVKWMVNHEERLLAILDLAAVLG